MGEALKVSFHEDDSFNLDHDNRVRVSRNVEKDRIGDNMLITLSLVTIWMKTEL